MRVFALLFAFAIILAVAYAAPQEQTDKTDDCVDEKLNLTLKRGEIGYPEGQCLRARCSEEGKMNLEPCEFVLEENCRVVDGDLTKQYPGCCPTVECSSKLP